MNIGILAVIILLVIVIITLIIYNLVIHKKIKNFSNINEKISQLKVLQEFMDTIGKDETVDNKIDMINNIIVEKYDIKYSTIVVFNGAEYILKASNVDKRFWDLLKNLHTDEMFKDSILTATPKYVTTNNANEKLEYQKGEMNRAKSAMFFPLYLDNIYIGYWIIESEMSHAFDGMDTSILGIIKDNIISVLKSVSYQNTIENIYRVDKATGLNSAEYLYGRGKKTIDKHGESTICMFTITNIEEINEKFGRNIGTDVIVNVANVVKSCISSEYILVRYMGPKFAIAFSGVDTDNVTDFIKEIKTDVENVSVVSENKRSKKQTYANPKTNFVLARYYKGTGIEEVTKKLEEYLDLADKSESDINCI